MVRNKVFSKHCALLLRTYAKPLFLLIYLYIFYIKCAINKNIRHIGIYIDLTEKVGLQRYKYIFIIYRADTREFAHLAHLTGDME